MAEKSRTPGSASVFPPAWLWLVDEAIPTFVKKHYSPRESWKNKPFSKEDAHFFFKGIEELSELFTEERPKNIPAYFQHPKFRSSYLLYFLPLQAAKFLTLFDLHARAVDEAIEHGRRTGVMRVADLGAGPGTASIALLIRLLGLRLGTGEELPLIEFDWIDTNASILQDGKELAEEIASHFPRLRGKVTVRTHAAPWWEAPRLLHGETSLILLGHVLNEAGGPFSRPNEAPTASDEDSGDESGAQTPHWPESWARLWSHLLRDRARGGGLLAVEPAAKRPSQFLSNLRDQFFASGILPDSATSLWGPCLHAGRCPLAQGRDWCHFSVPVRIPGQWFLAFSKGLGSERQWAKFSYLWIASPDRPAPAVDAGLRRVISDPMSIERGRESGPKAVLLCEPERPGRHPVRAHQSLWRGDVVRPGTNSGKPGSRPRSSRARD